MTERQTETTREIPVPLAFLKMPTITLDTNDPSTAMITFKTNRPVETSLRVWDGKRGWEVHFEVDDDPTKGLTLTELSPNRNHTIRIFIQDKAGQVVQAPKSLSLITPE